MCLDYLHTFLATVSYAIFQFGSTPLWRARRSGAFDLPSDRLCFCSFLFSVWSWQPDWSGETILTGFASGWPEYGPGARCSDFAGWPTLGSLYLDRPYSIGSIQRNTRSWPHRLNGPRSLPGWLRRPVLLWQATAKKLTVLPRIHPPLLTFSRRSVPTYSSWDCWSFSLRSQTGVFIQPILTTRRWPFWCCFRWGSSCYLDGASTSMIFR